MPAEGVPAFLRYRVLNANTGAEVIGDLPHLHQSSWTVRALSPASPGSATLGDFSIPLHAPYSDEGKRAWSTYQLLAPGQKIEAYLGDVGAGDPKYSGVITKLSKPLDRPWMLTGSDTLWWLQQCQVYEGETIGPGFASDLAGCYLGTREVVFDGQPNTTFVGTWGTTTADPQFNLPAQTYAQTGVNAVALAPTSYNAVNEFNWPSGSTPARGASLNCWGTIYSGTSTSNAGEAGVVWLWDVPTTTGYMALVYSVQTTASSGVYNIGVQIWRVVAGAFSLVSATNNVFVNVPPVFPFQFTVYLSNLAPASTIGHVMNVFINGRNTGCQAAELHANLVRTSGKVGYFSSIAAGGSPIVYFNGLRFDSRTASQITPTTWGTDRFTKGTITAGTATVEPIPGQGQSQLDMILLGSTLDGFNLRKTPKAGYKSDVLDYGPNLGTDRSASIAFEEGVNVDARDTGVGPISDLYATATRVNAVPGVNSGGTVIIPSPANGEGVGGNPASGGDIVLIDTISDVGIPGATMLISYAMLVGQRKASPISATQVRVIRDPAWADLLREWDYVTIHLPTAGLNRLKQQVLGYTFVEGQATQLYFLNQFPASAFVQQQMQRLARSVEWITNPQTYS